jgi:glycosyltransferase involved in cell wall biosynthesis
MVVRRFANARIPSDVVGVGVEPPESAEAERFRAAYRVNGPLFLYVGRIVESKGCRELFDLWARWRATTKTAATLVLAGHREMAVPERADVRYVGEIPERDKWDAYAACTALLVPERLQSLSLVALEAWAMGRPVVCPAQAPVLASMSRRASGGLPYRSFPEFAEICELLLERPDVGARLGRRGREFVARTYTWPLVTDKYLDLFAEVRARIA